MSSKTEKMTSPEERERRLRRLNRNAAARSLRNFKPQKIPNKKKRQKYEPDDLDYTEIDEMKWTGFHKSV